MLVVQSIPVGARLFDTVAPLSLAELQALKAAGCEGLILYLGGNLTSATLADATGIGLGVAPVNFSRKEGWIPSATLGTSDAQASIANLSALHIPVRGLDDWCDIEGCGANPTSYCEAWCAEVLGDGAGRVAGEYIGAGALLAGHQHYLLPFEGYWHSCSSQIPEPDCGFKLFQLFPPDQKVSGIEIDFNFACRDFRGRAPTWVKEA
jgi:hypothetical protein